MMKKIILTLALMLIATPVFSESIPNLPAESAIKKLQQGNERYVELDLKHPNQTKERRDALTKGQHPFAIVITCSDSRVPAEILFDQGLGDIFVIRNAGNVLDEHVMGSVEYAVEHLGVNLVVVMGHESCGAVAATMNDAEGSKYIESIKKSIHPAIAEAKKENKCDAETVTKDNAKLVAEKIMKESEVVQHAAKFKGLKVVPAYYHLDSGKVEFLCK